MSPCMGASYYGAACFALPSGKVCRGNIAIFRLMLTERKWKTTTPTGADVLFQMSDDDSFEFEYELYPVCKAEVAQLLYERTKALEEGAFTRRTWRSQTRRLERNEELSKRTTLTFGM